MFRARPEAIESTANGGEFDPEFGAQKIDPNRLALDARGYFYQSDSSEDAEVYTTRTNSGNLAFRDTFQTAELSLSDLIFIFSPRESHVIYVRVAGLVSSVQIKNTAETQNIATVDVTRTGGLVSQIVVKRYDGAGVVIPNQTFTGSIIRSGGLVSAIHWVVS